MDQCLQDHCCWRRDPPLDGFHDPGLAFGGEEEDKEDNGNSLQDWNVDEGTMMTTTTMVAVGGAMPKDDETGSLLPVAAMAMALQNILLAPPRPIGN
jgi:hypothetical protein